MSDTPTSRVPAQLSPLVHLSNNWGSLIGVVVVTTATVFWLFLLPTLLGNILGGVLLVTILNHGAIKPEIDGSQDK